MTKEKLSGLESFLYMMKDYSASLDLITKV